MSSPNPQVSVTHLNNTSQLSIITTDQSREVSADVSPPDTFTRFTTTNCDVATDVSTDVSTPDTSTCGTTTNSDESTDVSTPVTFTGVTTINCDVSKDETTDVSPPDTLTCVTTINCDVSTNVSPLDPLTGVTTTKCDVSTDVSPPDTFTYDTTTNCDCECCRNSDKANNQLLHSGLIDEAATILVENEVLKIDAIDLKEKIKSLELQLKCKDDIVGSLTKSRNMLKIDSKAKISELQYDIDVKINENVKLNDEVKQLKVSVNRLKNEIKNLKKNKKSHPTHPPKPKSQAPKANTNPTSVTNPWNLVSGKNRQCSQSPTKTGCVTEKPIREKQGPAKVFTRLIGDENVRGMGPITQTSDSDTVVLTNSGSSFKKISDLAHEDWQDDVIVISVGSNTAVKTNHTNPKQFEQCLRSVIETHPQKEIIITEIPSVNHKADQVEVKNLNNQVKSMCDLFSNAHYLETNLRSDQLNTRSQINRLGKLQVALRVMEKIKAVKTSRTINFCNPNLIRLT